MHCLSSAWKYTHRAAHLLLGGSLLVAATAVANTDYESAVAHTLEAAGAVQSYDVSGTLLFENAPLDGSDGMKLNASFDMAGRWPDRLLSAESSAMFEMNLGTGPDGAWFYLRQAGAVYRGAAATLTRDLTRDEEFDLDPAKIYNFYAGLKNLLLEDGLVVSEVGDGTLTIDGREIPCRVIMTAAEDEADESGVRQGPRAFWYDPVSGLCLKTETTLYGQRNGVGFEQKTTRTVTRFALNEDVAEDRFAFATPAGAREADSFERLLNPDSMTGLPAPEVTFTGLDGRQFSLSDYRGQVVFLDIWATWCGPCRMEMPHIETLYRELGASGEIAFLAASAEDRTTITNWLRKNPYTFPIAMVSEEMAHSRLKAVSIPTGFVIDRGGIIRAHMVGAQTEGALRRALAKAGIGQ